MKISIVKPTMVIIIILSLPLNAIIFDGIGNLYLSSVILFCVFFVFFFLLRDRLINNKISIIALGILLITCFTTIVNILVTGDLIDTQLKQSIVYTQNSLSVVLFTYFFKKINPEYFFKIFLTAVSLCFIRVYIEEPNHIFKLSVLWDARIESEFVAGVNTFALLNGLAFIITFFVIKKKFLKFIMCAFYLTVIVLTMSRGALLGLMLTTPLVVLYYQDAKARQQFFDIMFFALFLSFFVVLNLNNSEDVLEIIKNRFFSIFYSDISVNSFFAGRGEIIDYTIKNYLNSSLFQFILGHGNGSMEFIIPETGQKFETSHFVIFDILYRNGVILTTLYLSLLFHIINLFLRNRKKENTLLFSLFVFFQLELLVNPMIFSPQAGWIYFAFTVLFLKKLKSKHQ